MQHPGMDDPMAGSLSQLVNVGKATKLVVQSIVMALDMMSGWIGDIGFSFLIRGEFVLADLAGRPSFCEPKVVMLISPFC